MSKYKLYSMDQCPFCKKVLRAIEKYGVDIEIADLYEENNSNELEEKGGKVQVPALEIDGEIMYESSDIIKYIKENMVG